MAVHCIVRRSATDLEYDSPYEVYPHAFRIATMVLDCIDLVRNWIVRCDSNRFCHACGRHAPRLGPTICDPVSFLAALGIGNAACAAAGSPISSRAIAALLHVGHALWHLRRNRSGFRPLDPPAIRAPKPL